MNSRNFWVAAIERAVKTVAQTAVAAIVASNVSSVFDVDTGAVVGVSALAGILSILTSIGSTPAGPVNSPSVTQSR
jgi:Putative lactococcus lactis phage r1t holin